jgi:hypothetical protein
MHTRSISIVVGLLILCLNLTFASPTPVSFLASKTYDAGIEPFSVAVGDFNGDGIPDMAVTSYNVVNILLGKGDGTFQAPVGYGAGSSAYAVAVGDFNGDGKLDLVVTDAFSASNIVVLMGNGDGTFQPAVGYGTGQYPYGLRWEM